MQKAHDVCRKHLMRSAERIRDRYDANKQMNTYNTGDAVWCLNERRTEGVCPKLQPAFIGPWVMGDSWFCVVHPYIRQEAKGCGPLWAKSRQAEAQLSKLCWHWFRSCDRCRKHSVVSLFVGIVEELYFQVTTGLMCEKSGYMLSSEKMRRNDFGSHHPPVSSATATSPGMITSKKPFTAEI